MCVILFDWFSTKGRSRARPRAWIPCFGFPAARRMIRQKVRLLLLEGTDLPTGVLCRVQVPGHPSPTLDLCLLPERWAHGDSGGVAGHEGGSLHCVLTFGIVGFLFERFQVWRTFCDFCKGFAI